MGRYQEDPARRGFRFPAGVSATFVDDGQVVACNALNVSRSGALLAGSSTVPTAQQLDLTLTTPNGQLSLSLSARVLRVSPTTEGEGHELSLEFVGLDDARREKLDVFLARLLEAPPTGPFDSLRPNSPPLEVKKVLEAIPLPQRIALAQRSEARQREFLRQDQHPLVLEAVVRNPGLTLAEARIIASHLALPGTAIELLAGDPRFRSDEEVRLALATNPKVPLPIAERLTSDLKPPQLRKLLARPGINPALRDKLFRKLTRG